MFKNFLFFVFLFIFFIMNNCSVGISTGLLVITNLTDISIDNFKVGNTTIFYKLNKGEKYDYWYFSDVKGKITANSIDNVLVPYYMYQTGTKENNYTNTYMIVYKDNAICNFKTNFQYNIDIKKINKKYQVVVGEGFRSQFRQGTGLDFPGE